MLDFFPWTAITRNRLSKIDDACQESAGTAPIAGASHQPALALKRPNGIIEDMIEIAQGNLLKAPVEALVNTVNTVGVMGKESRCNFGRRFPMFLAPTRRRARTATWSLAACQVSDLGGLVGRPALDH